MDVFNVFSVEDVTDRFFLGITGYAYRYFEIPNIKAINLWSKMLDPNKDKMAWKAALLVVELCFCAPISNAMLKRLFSHMNLVKTNIQNKLSNSILRNRINGISMQTFTTSSSISSFSTGITQRIVVYSKKQNKTKT